jgi:hypothetical protein
MQFERQTLRRFSVRKSHAARPWLETVMEILP